ncbi:MAG: hypothetical protein IJP17_03250, partial [Clostridia bacterium]|nr:hypothetical protein [Clostridia bacterium]
MLYNIDFNIAAAILMIVTIGSYVSRKHLHDMQSRVFAVTLIGTLLALLLDTSTVLAENYWGASPQVLWWLNTSFLVTFHLLPVLVTTYMHIVVGQIKNIARGRWVLLLLPSVMTIAVIITSRWTGLVMYIDENGKYAHGPLHSIIYVTAMLYIVILAVLCVRNHRAIGTRKLFSSLLFILLLVM